MLNGSQNDIIFTKMKSRNKSAFEVAGFNKRAESTPPPFDELPAH
jgi:hypothetical protein